MDYANLAFIVPSIGASAYLLATGIHRLRLPEPTPRVRRWWARWLARVGAIRPSAPPSSEALDEVSSDLSRMGAVRRVCIGAGLALGTALGVGIALISAGTVVSRDSDVLTVLMAPTLVGLVAGWIAAVSLHSLWRDPASSDRGVSLVQPLVRVLPGLLVVVIASTFTSARLLGRLATYAYTYRSDDPYFHSITRDHPWTLWVLPVCLAAMFACLLFLSLKLRSMPLFRSRDASLALAAGRQWRSQMLFLVALFNPLLGMWGEIQISSLQLSDSSLSELMYFLLLAIGVGGMILSLFAPDRMYAHYAHG